MESIHNLKYYTWVEQQARDVKDLNVCKDTSKHFAEKISSMTAMDGPSPVEEGGTYPIVGNQEGYSKTVEHTEWKSAFQITEKAMEDAQILNLRKQPTGFITSWERTKVTFGVVREDDRRLLAPFYRSSFFFDAKIFQQFSLVSIELKKVYRQSDPTFIGILDHIRTSQV